jgi:dTDP-D-glucose 4,6-dehydratase
LIGYEPKIKFEDGIERFIEWYKKNNKWFKYDFSYFFFNFFNKKHWH